ncbi:MAG: thioredoxin family protein [Patescibacteria group bacterium]
MKTFGIILGVLVVAIVGGWFFIQTNGPFSIDTGSDNEIACPADAMQCPDGSYVSRTGSQCEFAKCPESNANQSMKHHGDNPQMTRAECEASNGVIGDGFENGYQEKRFLGTITDVRCKCVCLKKDESATMDTRDGGAILEYQGKVLAGNSDPLFEFSKKDYDRALASGKLVVLYFYANWCPECKEEFPKMESVFTDLTVNKVIGFRVNYKDNDTSSEEEDIAREFGIAYQHTKVFVKNGTRVLKDGTSWDESRYDSEINKFLK